MTHERFAPYGRNVRAALLGLAIASSALLSPLGSHPAYADNRVPYADAEAKGTITFCDKARKPVHGGAVSDKPFVWTAVSSERAPAPYDGATRTATLFAFQPR